MIIAELNAMQALDVREIDPAPNTRLGLDSWLELCYTEHEPNRIAL